MRSSPAAQPSQNGWVSGVGTGTGLPGVVTAIVRSPHHCPAHLAVPLTLAGPAPDGRVLDGTTALLAPRAHPATTGRRRPTGSPAPDCCTAPPRIRRRARSAR